MVVHLSTMWMDTKLIIKEANMKVLEFYDGTKTYMYPNMKLATPEVVLADFPAILAFKHVIETDENGQVLFAVENFSAMRSRYNIDKNLTDDEALEAIQEIINATPEPVLDDNTRIADALEDLVVLNMPDEEVQKCLKH